MSRYRSEETSLRARISSLRDELAMLDRAAGEGAYARTPFARRMYRLGLATAGWWRRFWTRDGARRVAMLQRLARSLEARLAARRADVLQRQTGAAPGAPSPPYTTQAPPDPGG